VAGFQPLRRRVDLFDDAAEPADWMAGRNADIATRADAELAGRETWDRATRTGEDLAAARPDDVIRLGAMTMRNGAPTDRWTEPAQRSDGDEEVSPIQLAEAAGPLARLPDIRFAAARPNDSISKLLGTSHPAAIGRFLTLNGMDPRSSTLLPGRNYAIPTQVDDASREEVTAGARILRQDNARALALRAQRAALLNAAQLNNAPWADSSGGLGSRWPTEKPIRGGFVSALPTPETPTWWDRSKTGRSIARGGGYAPGVLFGAGRGLFHMAKDGVQAADLSRRFWDPSDLLLSPPGQSALSQIIRTEKGLLDAAREGISDPAGVKKKTEDWGRRQYFALNPFATPLAPTAAEELRKGFSVGANDGELASNFLVPGGVAARSFRGFEFITKEAEMARLMEQGFTAKQADRLSELYKGQGSHFFAKRWAKKLGLPDLLANNQFTVLKPTGIRQAQMYELHSRVDRLFNVARIPRKYDGGVWNAKRLGIEKYDPLKSVLYGAPPATKGAVGGFFGGAPVVVFDEFGGDQSQ
jgi:hypothetical protein